MSDQATARVVQLEAFRPAATPEPGNEDMAFRAFRTLFVDAEPASRGGSAALYRVTNYKGDIFALKVSKATASQNGADKNAPEFPAPFYEEFRMHCAVSNLRGFPEVHGIGFVNECPAILMEWVEGVTLHSAVADFLTLESANDHDGQNHGELQDRTERLVPLGAIAALGTAVLDVLESANALEPGFVHRDLSPYNIMLRTDAHDIAAQFAQESFDVCLVDFGSASFSAPGSKFTLETGLRRCGTPDYAPPEMLTEDVDIPHADRGSEKVDCYALCSVLFELYCGRTPYQLALQPDASPYRVKTDHRPPTCEVREGDGGFLAYAIGHGLLLDQKSRPTREQLRSALVNWRREPGARPPHSSTSSERFERGMWQPDYSARLLTRRRFIAAGVIGAAVIVSAALIGGKALFGKRKLFDESALQMASAPYDGEPLYKVLDSERPGWALANRAGQIVCKPDTSKEIGNLCEGMASCYLDEAQGYGFIVPDGEGSYAWAIPPRFSLVADFSEGLACAQSAESGLWGFIDQQGSWAIPAQFSQARSFSAETAAVYDERDGLWGAVDAEGRWAIEPRFAALGSCDGTGHAVAQIADTVGDAAGLWGVADKTGAWAAEPQFALMRRFANGRAPALEAEGGLWGYVDSRGAWVVKPQFRDARPFSEGVAAVQDAKSQLWYFIRIDGKPAHDMKPLFWKLGELVNGLAPAQASADDDTVTVGSGDVEAEVTGAGMRYGYVDEYGQWQMRQLTTLVDVALGAPDI